MQKNTPLSADHRVISIGETMAMVTPLTAQSLREAQEFGIHAGGAECTVALYLADAGYRSEWVSRLGDDPLGQRILDHVSHYGVGTSQVELYPHAPTGVYFKDPGDQATTVYFYRSGSAASTMGPEMLDRLDPAGAGIIHISGITAGLSQSCRELLSAVFAWSREHQVLVSYDVNYRPGLWDPATAGPVLAGYAAQADLVFVGRDEAETLWGIGDPDELRHQLKISGRLIVKDGDYGATEVSPEGQKVFVPAHRVDVVEVVGAGDAFTAGYLGALLDGEGPAERLLRGHDTAARALRSTQDFVPRAAENPPPITADRVGY
ncbi:sugar kinase [Nesterenkonia flava]|uniref:Sugar kinase n=1 Tax=Nesterenkonia flava TaxID=469799 RepID=A0ABU1FVL3_9MICC|nr:sugar kinase [Nesterenkonia flava]MDR5712658.1 sugar kinase [Nesterenkonia flava]